MLLERRDVEGKEAFGTGGYRDDREGSGIFEAEETEENEYGAVRAEGCVIDKEEEDEDEDEEAGAGAGEAEEHLGE